MKSKSHPQMAFKWSRNVLSVSPRIAASVQAFRPHARHSRALRNLFWWCKDRKKSWNNKEKSRKFAEKWGKIWKLQGKRLSLQCHKWLSGKHDTPTWLISILMWCYLSFSHPGAIIISISSRIMLLHRSVIVLLGISSPSSYPRPHCHCQ